MRSTVWETLREDVVDADQQGSEVVSLQQAIEVAAAALCQQEEAKDSPWHEGYHGGPCMTCRERVQIVAPGLHHAGRVQGEWWDEVAHATAAAELPDH